MAEKLVGQSLKPVDLSNSNRLQYPLLASTRQDYLDRHTLPNYGDLSHHDSRPMWVPEHYKKTAELI